MNLSYSLYLLAESLYSVRNSFLYSSWYIIEFLSEWMIDDTSEKKEQSRKSLKLYSIQRLSK